MPKRCLCLLCLLLALSPAAAQQPDDVYYPYLSESEERAPMLTADTALFYRAIHSAPDLYAACADFRLSFVGSKRRGQPWSAESASVAGLDLPYRYFPAMRLLGADEDNVPGVASTSSSLGGAAGIRTFDFPEYPRSGHAVSVNFTDRNYRAGAKLSFAGELGRGWSGAAAAELRTGRDMYIEGVFTNAATAAFRLSKRTDRGNRFDLAVVVPPSLRGLRSAATEEAFTLTGDRLYNPSWGFQHGKVRNSHVRREFVPLALATYRIGLSASTTLALAAAGEYGVRKYSALGWYNARTPLPDNYRFMPSYTQNPVSAEMWRANDPRYTQIAWDELIAQNRMAAGHAVYALEDRVDRSCDLHFDAAFSTVLDSRLTLRYGAFFRWSQTRSYKQMSDLLGAYYITDIDQYLVDDDSYSNLLQNDLRNPSRTITEGDRFGYDYALRVRDAGLRLMLEYRSDRFRFDAGCTLRDAEVLRHGYYEKELYPGAQSYGPSRRIRFMPYAIKALAGWAFSPRSYLELAVMASSEVPDAADLFIQPQYNNRTVDDPAPEQTYAAEVNYRFKGRDVSLQFTAFATLALDRTETRRYYDDMANVFCDMAVSGIGTLACGVEAAADFRLSKRWNLSLAASAGRYKYARNPRVTVLSDVDNAVVDEAAESFMGDCTVGGAPQLTGCAELGYFGPKGWGFRLAGAYAGLRYVEPMPVRRTQRIARQGGATPELLAMFIRQERLDDAFRLDASLFKSFRFERSQLTFALMLRNLLGDRDAVYSGYESLRVRRSRAGDENFYMPQATRYTHAYPRSFYITVSYKF